MLFYISFYLFSLLLSYLDCTRYRIPNITIITLTLFLISFGFLENQINLYSFILPLLILSFFVIMLLIMPKMILGGGDIKYMMVIGLYLEPLLFPLFLISTGITQMFFLIYYQNFKKRKTSPMAPAMFLAVVISEVLSSLNIYPF